MRLYTYPDFLRDHSAALISMNVPEVYWPSVHNKLLGKIFDASEKFELGMLKYTSESTQEVVEKELFVSVKADEISALDPDNIFLSDHAWTFELADVRPTLESNATLLPRLKTMMCIDEEDKNAAIEAVMRKMWKFCRLYQLLNPSDKDENGIVLKKDVWYLLDEFGSSLKQSTVPNVRIASLFYIPEQVCYSFFWPIENLYKEDTLYVDWLSRVTDEKKPLLLIPWEGGDFSDRSSAHTFVLTDEFFTSHKIAETLPDPSAKLANSTTTPYLVYTDVDLVSKTLTSPNYQITSDRDKADIVWLRRHIRDYEWLSQNQSHVWLNQFPNESVLTVKDMLAALAASDRAIELSGPGDAFDFGKDNRGDDDEDQTKRALTSTWYPVTFNLYYELVQFVAFFQRRVEEISESAEEVGQRKETTSDLSQCVDVENCLRYDGEGGHVSVDIERTSTKHNIWIVKPWNLGRGLGICISDNLNQILRLNETGPMIASRYITDPVLFYREDISSWVKFDVRYVVLLKSVHPLRLYAHKVFWLRFANKQFSLDHFDDYAKHFTVMNYRTEDELLQVHHTDFIQAFEKQYPNSRWKDIEANIHKTLVKVFQTATAYAPPRGVGTYGKSRAMYAVDVLLEWQRRRWELPEETHSCGFQVEPQICEVNFIPDCTRACHYYPDFHNEIFDFLFLDRDSENIIRLM